MDKEEKEKRKQKLTFRLNSYVHCIMENLFHGLCHESRLEETDVELTMLDSFM